MKLYICADIEGVTGITSWNETIKGNSDYYEFAKQMTKEVSAACEGAYEAGYDDITIHDAHETGRNIILDELPEYVKIIRGFNGHPYCMMMELDSSYDAICMIGAHSNGLSDKNPLSHTLDPSIYCIKINDKLVSEFEINAYTGLMLNVPTVFVSGDEGVCLLAKEFNENIITVATNKGIGKSTLSISPLKSIKLIREKVKKALSINPANCKKNLPDYFKVEICYKHHFTAYRKSFYPDAELISPNIIRYESSDYYKILTMFSFLT